MKRRGEGCGLDGDGFYPLDLGDEGAGEDGNGYGGGEGGYDTSDGDAGVYSPNEKVSLVTWEYTEEKERE